MRHEARQVPSWLIFDVGQTSMPETFEYSNQSDDGLKGPYLPSQILAMIKQGTIRADALILSKVGDIVSTEDFMSRYDKISSGDGPKAATAESRRLSGMVADKKFPWWIVVVLGVAFIAVYHSDFELWLNLTGKLLLRAVVWCIAAFLAMLLLVAVAGLCHWLFRKIVPRKVSRDEAN